MTVNFEKKLNEGDGGNKDYRLAQSSLTSLHWSSTPIPNSNFTWGFLGPIAAFGSNVWISEQRRHDLLVRSHNSGKTLTTLVLPYPAREHSWMRIDSDVSRDTLGAVSHRNGCSVLLLG